MAKVDKGDDFNNPFQSVFVFRLTKDNETQGSAIIQNKLAQCTNQNTSAYKLSLLVFLLIVYT